MDEQISYRHMIREMVGSICARESDIGTKYIEGNGEAEGEIMKKKVSGIVLALLLMIQTWFGGSDWTVNASTNVPEPVSVQDSVYGVTDDVYGPSESEINNDSILTKVVLTDMDGTVIDAVYNPDSSLDIGAAVNLGYEWELPNGHNYKNGDSFTF